MFAGDVMQSCDDPAFKTWKLLTGTLTLVLWAVAVPSGMCFLLVRHHRLLKPSGAGDSNLVARRNTEVVGDLAASLLWGRAH